MAAVMMRVGPGSFASARVHRPALRFAASAILRSVSSRACCSECDDVTWFVFT